MGSSIWRLADGKFSGCGGTGSLKAPDARPAASLTVCPKTIANGASSHSMRPIYPIAGIVAFRGVGEERTNTVQARARLCDVLQQQQIVHLLGSEEHTSELQSLR